MATKYLKNQLTIAEMAKRVIGGDHAQIAEVLEEINEFLIDAPMYEASEAFGHVASVRDGLPTISGRRLNEGASKSASSVKQIRESICLLDNFSEPDEVIIDNQPDKNAAINDENMAFLEAMMQTFSNYMLYGNEGVDPVQLNGFFQRYNTLSLDNVVGLSGTGSDLSSVLMVEWGKGTAHLIYPRGSKKVGIDVNKMGKQRVTDSSGNPYMAYVTQFKMQFGLVVKDDRAVQRVANVESSGSTNNLLATGNMEKLIYARNRLPKMGSNAVIYVNRDLKSQFDIWAFNKTNINFTVEQMKDGTPITKFQGIPIRHVDQMLNTESAIS